MNKQWRCYSFSELCEKENVIYVALSGYFDVIVIIVFFIVIPGLNSQNYAFSIIGGSGGTSPLELLEPSWKYDERRSQI